MVLVDTSVWVGHLRKHSRELEDLLERDLVLMHTSVIGELACGSLKERDTFLRHLNALPAALEATARETLDLIQMRNLWGRGIGWVDAQLTASALLTRCWLWTVDERLSTVAAELGLKFNPS